MLPVRARRLWRRATEYLPLELVHWPYELFLVLTGVLVLGLSLTVGYALPFSITHTVGVYWALGWSALLLLASAIILHGLRRDEMEGIIVGLRMHGTLTLSYAAVTLTVGAFPLSILGASLMVTAGVVSLMRACALNRVRSMPPREW